MSTSKNVSIMCFHDELCQVFNAMMTALNLLRQGARVTAFFGSRGVNAIHRAKMPELRCLPDMPEMGEAVMKRRDELELPLLEDLFFMFTADGGEVLACPLNIPLFGMSERDQPGLDRAGVARPAARCRGACRRAAAAARRPGRRPGAGPAPPQTGGETRLAPGADGAHGGAVRRAAAAGAAAGLRRRPGSSP